jgi:hypothetical protein
MAFSVSQKWSIFCFLKERNKRYVDISLQDTDKFLQDNANKNTIYKTKFDMKLFYDWAQENVEMRKVEEIPHPELIELQGPLIQTGHQQPVVRVTVAVVLPAVQTQSPHFHFPVG